LYPLIALGSVLNLGWSPASGYTAGMKPKWIITLVATAVFAGGALVVFLFMPAEARSHTAAVRNQYLNGDITLEDARREVGDIVDTQEWEKLKAEWQASK